MKNIIYSIIFFIGILSLGYSPAYTQDACAFIGDDITYDICCSTQTIGANIAQCTAYLSGPRCASIVDRESYDMCCGLTSPASNRENCLNYKEKQTTPPVINCSAINNDADYTKCCATTSSQNTEKCQNYVLKDADIPKGRGTVSIPGRRTNSSDNGFVLNTSTNRPTDQCKDISFVSFLNILIWGKCVINSFVIPLIFTLAFVFFLWNIMQFIRASDKSNRKEEARQRMVWGMVALFVMVAVWGIVAIATEIFEIEPTVPMLQTEYLNPDNADK